jgi:hypothetical protein
MEEEGTVSQAFLKPSAFEVETANFLRTELAC